ncbi:MAG: hypothetical protein KZQ93_14655 [Candidatus Thiodiazotropha sp. (ex Monitilora ramsayi)]|nr:hypothetical protein [Candidatus Thiodiazotropha sp. (ex Monitilora ramsayi)]
MCTVARCLQRYLACQLQVRNGDHPGVMLHTYRLGSMTCLAGDIIGEYSFDHTLTVGERVIFEDMITTLW